MFEVPIIAWVVAVVLAAVVFSFCGYEVWWKARRLQRDMLRLQGDLERLQALQEQVGQLQAAIELTRARARAASD